MSAAATLPRPGAVLRALGGLLTLMCALAATAAENWVAGPGGVPMALADAVAKARDGDVIELLEGSYRGGLVIEKRRLTLRGMGKVQFKGEGKPSADKALITVRGGEVTLENLEFRGMRGQDGSGAGVLLEGGKLTVRNGQFFDNEHGLRALHDEKAEIVIENSAFGQAPRIEGGLCHLLFVGRIGKLSVTGTRFQQGFEGHLIKSRARENLISYNFIHDGLRGGASYEIEIANGGVARIIGNVIAQGSSSQNPVLVAYGTEGQAWPKNTLVLAHNTLVNYGWLPAWFLRVLRDRLPEDTEVYAINNLTVGLGVFWLGASGHFEGNRHALLGMLRDAETYAFELAPGSIWRGAGVDPRNVKGIDMAPRAEFEWPASTVPLDPARSSWSPGAYQR